MLATFVFDSSKIIMAMKGIRHDRLIIVTGRENTETPGYEEIMKVAELLGKPAETLLVDKFDLMDSLNSMDDRIREVQESNDEVVVNISGGVPLLSDAALLAAMNNGCEAYYIDDLAQRRTLVKLPVLNVRVDERLTSEQKHALVSIGDGMQIVEPGKRNGDHDKLLRAIQQLKNMKLVNVDNSSINMMVYHTRQGRYMSEWIKRC